ncbi:hypothetical protein [Ornithinibacillus gellani]|uniref:hypothetical protein n=1 Tax=Ornithinibacillus gellani TaxID=2293253 RepID=UPI0016801B91|nr:hypothetical protein [Ornithinibacillus gellani]
MKKRKLRKDGKWRMNRLSQLGIVEKLKEKERKLFLDGQKRANDIEAIKTTVDQRINK